MKQPTRAPSRRLSTPEALARIAEQLWGERGVDAVSLREISAVAGLANPASVQYHFGGRDGLINAIYAYRLPSLDSRRRELLSAAQEDDAGPDIRTLLDCLFRPLFEQVDEHGRRSYASFLRQVLQLPKATGLRERAMELTPITGEIIALIHKTMADVPSPLADHRVLAANFLMLDVLNKLDNNPVPGLDAEAIYADTLDMLSAGITRKPAETIYASLNAAS